LPDPAMGDPNLAPRRRHRLARQGAAALLHRPGQAQPVRGRPCRHRPWSPRGFPAGSSSGGREGTLGEEGARRGREAPPKSPEAGATRTGGDRGLCVATVDLFPLHFILLIVFGISKYIIFTIRREEALVLLSRLREWKQKWGTTTTTAQEGRGGAA
jgi:hypothetical protein